LLQYLVQDTRLRVIGSKHIEDRTATISINVLDSDNAQVAFELSQGWGIETRVGLHCAPLAHATMHTLQSGTLRFSPGYATTEDEIDKTIEALQTVLSRT
jgi:selenocysteine lyase/cysteine desulfurase